MLHLADGTLRRLHDEPASGADAERVHLAGCASCTSRLARLARAADEARDALVIEPEHTPDVAAAHAVVVARSLTSRSSPRPLGAGRIAGPSQVSAPLVGIAAALAFVLLFALTPLRGIANSFLAIFEPRQIVAVPVTRADLQQLRALPDLGSFGTVREGPTPLRATATTTAQAAALAGMPVAVPGLLPPGSSRAVYFVQGRTEATFTFSAAKARAAAAAAGKNMPAMPPRIDGSTLIVALGPIVVASYCEPVRGPGRRGGIPKLFVAQAPAPQVGSTGASAREIESFLLAQPGVPPQLAAEIAAIGDPATTLPIPIPIDKAYATQVDVQGVRGLALGDNTGLGSGVVWERGRMIYAVGGALPMAEVLAVANALQTASFAPLKALVHPISPRH